jgi:hypothetical protein
MDRLLIQLLRRSCIMLMSFGSTDPGSGPVGCPVSCFNATPMSTVADGHMSRLSNSCFSMCESTLTAGTSIKGGSASSESSLRSLRSILLSFRDIHPSHSLCRTCSRLRSPLSSPLPPPPLRHPLQPARVRCVFFVIPWLDVHPLKSSAIPVR